MLLTVVFAYTAVAGLTAAYLFYSRSRGLTAERERLHVLLQESEKEKDAAIISQAQSAKEIDLLREYLKAEREKRAADEQQLKEQLTAIAKDVVQQGNSAIKTENRSQLEQLLQPFKEKLATFEQEVRESKEKSLHQHASMETLVKALSEQHAHMNNTAQNLADALRGDQKTQGNWGELALERILEMSGLQKDVEYIKQTSFRSEDNSLQRPDFLIRLPENKHIVIDSKVSLTAFERYINAENDEMRENALKLHVLSINNHVKELGNKNYSYLEGLQTPEFVLLFMPMEASLALAIKSVPDIYSRAWEKRVVIVTPSTLLATLKTIESIWKQERQNMNAVNIAIEAGRLYDKFVGFIDDLKKIEKNQQTVSASFREAFGKLSEGPGNIVGKIEKLKKLGAKAGKQIDSNLLEDSSETTD